MGAGTGAEEVSGSGSGLPVWRWERETPFLVLDPGLVVGSYRGFRETMPGITPHFAVKCQPDRAVLSALAGAGSCFEVASAAELRELLVLGVDPSRVVFSHPVKSAADIDFAARAGVDTFAVDSPGELVKLRELAPGAQVMARLRTAAGSEVASEGTYGVDPVSVATLLLAAADMGLDASGIAFHVGSQCVTPASWIQPIEDAASVMRRLARYGLRVRTLDIGGGFPSVYAYNPPPPAMADYARVITDALDTLDASLPFGVDRVIAEPGRAIAAEAGTMIATVIGTARRNGKMWAHLDVGVFHGFMESLETGCGIPWPVHDSRRDAKRQMWHLAGPSCDSQDVIAHYVELSAGLRPGDRVAIRHAGAYTNAYLHAFNGFREPVTIHRSTLHPTADDTPDAASGAVAGGSVGGGETDV